MRHFTALCNYIFFQSLSTIDFTTVIGQPEMEAIGQGLMSISIHARNAPNNLIRGFLGMFSHKMSKLIFFDHRNFKQIFINNTV